MFVASPLCLHLTCFKERVWTTGCAGSLLNVAAAATKKKRGGAFVSVHWLVSEEKAVEKERAHDTFLTNPGNERKPQLHTFASANWCF